LPHKDTGCAGCRAANTAYHRDSRRGKRDRPAPLAVVPLPPTDVGGGVRAGVDEELEMMPRAVELRPGLAASVRRLADVLDNQFAGSPAAVAAQLREGLRELREAQPERVGRLEGLRSARTG
jgi:hypothetical protein